MAPDRSFPTASGTLYSWTDGVQVMMSSLLNDLEGYLRLHRNVSP